VEAAVSSSISALVVAIVGVFGTLFAPIVGQRLTARTRREEFERDRDHKSDEYVREQQRARFSEKRNCYLSLSISAGRYRSELMRYLHKVRIKTLDENARPTLEETRYRFLASVYETRLTGRLKVVERLDTLREEIAKAYAATMNLAEGNPGPNGSFDEIRASISVVWDRAWPPLLIAMREDLGIED
jgi:hypothetical protein